MTRFGAKHSTYPTPGETDYFRRGYEDIRLGHWTDDTLTDAPMESYLRGRQYAITRRLIEKFLPEWPVGQISAPAKVRVP